VPQQSRLDGVYGLPESLSRKGVSISYIPRIRRQLNTPRPQSFFINISVGGLLTGINWERIRLLLAMPY
jgi:hypothetical protein